MAFGWPGRRVRGSKRCRPCESDRRAVPRRRRRRPRRQSVQRRARHPGRSLGREAREPRDDGVGRAVADAGGAERAVERAGDASDAVEHAVVAQTVGEITGRPHGADRVGARGSYPDGEQLERRDVRSHPSRLRRASRTHRGVRIAESCAEQPAARSSGGRVCELWCFSYARAVEKPRVGRIKSYVAHLN